MTTVLSMISLAATGLYALNNDEAGRDDWLGEISFYNRFPAGARKDATCQSIYMVGGSPKQRQSTFLKHPYFQQYRDDASYDPVTVIY